MVKGDSAVVSEVCSDISRQQQVLAFGKANVVYECVSVQSGLPSVPGGCSLILPSKLDSQNPTHGFVIRNKNTVFTDSTLPLRNSTDMTAFSDTDDSYVRAVSRLDQPLTIPGNLLNKNVTRFCDGAGAMQQLYNFLLESNKKYFKECPGGATGKTNGTSGGGTYGSSSSYASGGGMQSSWVTGAGGFLGIGGGSGDDDDDPWNQRPRTMDLIPSHYDEEFDPFEYLDMDELAQDIAQDIFRNGPLTDFVIDGQYLNMSGFNRDPSANLVSEEPSDPVPSTPAPMTPGPMTPSYSFMPSTPNNMMINPSTPSSTINNSPSVNISTSDQSEMATLIEIQQMMNNPGFSTSTTLVPPQPTVPSYSHNSLLSQTPIRMPTQVSMDTAYQQPSMTTSQRRTPSIDFFNTKMFTHSDRRVIELSVIRHLPHEKSKIAHQALQHCHTVYLQYQELLRNSNQAELPVAVKKVAHLCHLDIGQMNPSLCFSMPKNCITLDEWMTQNAESCDIPNRALILQQIVNTLVVLFKGPNELCFWGSFQVWVDSRMHVYLYVDFNSSLAIQKEYADSREMRNPRSEDCRVLAQMYNALLKPYLQRDMTWVSPQLLNIFTTFEQLVSSPTECVRNMAMVARVLGERRICKLQVDLTVTGFQYTVYCVEHEPVSHALQVMAGVVPAAVAQTWAVLHCNGNNTPVSITEVAARECRSHFMLVPFPDGQRCLPAALYITSQQRFW